MTNIKLTYKIMQKNNLEEIGTIFIKIYNYYVNMH